MRDQRSVCADAEDTVDTLYVRHRMEQMVELDVIGTSRPRHRKVLRLLFLVELSKTYWAPNR